MEQRFEHNVTSIGMIEVRKKLAEKEKEGWELVVVTEIKISITSYYTLFFKRPVKTTNSL